MFERQALKSVEYGLSHQAAVALLGPRQVGKTTLAHRVAEGKNALYLDLENSNDRAKLVEPSLFLESHSDRLVILDEIHRVPSLFPELRGIIDQGRREGKRTGRFLILGSASYELLHQSGESLAGRINYIEMGPLTPFEVGGDRRAREQLWLRGGFPGSLLADDDRESVRWRRDFIRTYLERDVPSFGVRFPATALERLWMMLAHRQGSMLNASDIGRALELSTQTVTRYIDLLCDLMLVRRLQPYHANIGKRLVKSPKVYVRDSGLVHALLGIETLDALAGHPVVGMSWEGFVLEALISQLPWGVRPYFFRTAAGAEVDLVLEFPDISVWLIEVKRSLSGRIDRGFVQAREDLKPTRSFVVHAGDDRYPMRDGVEAIDINGLAKLLIEK
jgi:predicted AAA+ superfamily ATPase